MAQVKSGDKIKVFNTDKGKIAILVCYDCEFPELARIAVSKGAKMIFVPFNTDDRRAYLRVRYCAQARAIENQVYVVITGCVGNLPDVENLDVHFSQSARLRRRSWLRKKRLLKWQTRPSPIFWLLPATIYANPCMPLDFMSRQ